MGKVHVDMSMSLDGFVAGPNAGPHNALGDGGHRIQQWLYDVESWRERQTLEGGQTNQDDEVYKETSSRTGAYVMGRRMFDEGEVGWADPRLSAPQFSSSLATRGNRGSGRRGRPSRSSPTTYRAPLSRQEQQRARRTSRYRGARPSSGSTSKLGWSTSCRSTSPPCCSAMGCGCSMASTRMLWSWKSRG
jgi:hypothetical protein